MEKNKFPIIVAHIEVGQITIDQGYLIEYEMLIDSHPLIQYTGFVSSVLQKYISKKVEIILDEMELVPRRSFKDQFVCKLTKDIDQITGIGNDHILSDYGHYIYIDDYEWKHLNEPLAIRVPGCTVGALWLDEDHKISNIELYNGRIMKYPSDINETMKKYIGVELTHENL